MSAPRSATSSTSNGQFYLLSTHWLSTGCVVGDLSSSPSTTSLPSITLHRQPFRSSGFNKVLAASDALIVHTHAAKCSLPARGVDVGKIHVIPHGPLGSFSQEDRQSRSQAYGRWRYLLFGKLQHYKGIDVLVEAAGLLSDEQRKRIEILIVGEALMNLVPVFERIKALRLEGCVTLQPGFVAQENVRDLLLSANAYVFPYRSIDASGVLHMVMDTGRWMVASDLGAFRDVIVEGRNGSLVKPGAVRDLAEKLLVDVGRLAEPTGRYSPTWSVIGAATRDLYSELLSGRRSER